MNHEIEWRPIESAPRDGSLFLIATATGVVSTWYDKGSGWSDDPINGRDYEGPALVCYDDAFHIEIEETPDGELWPGVLGWMPMPTLPPALTEGST